MKFQETCGKSKWNWELTKETSMSTSKSSPIFQIREEEEAEQWQAELEDNMSICGTRPIQDIYQRCNVVIFEPIGYYEVAKIKNGKRQWKRSCH